MARDDGRRRRQERDLGEASIERTSSAAAASEGTNEGNFLPLRASQRASAYPPLPEADLRTTPRTRTSLVPSPSQTNAEGSGPKKSLLRTATSRRRRQDRQAGEGRRETLGEYGVNNHWCVLPASPLSPVPSFALSSLPFGFVFLRPFASRSLSPRQSKSTRLHSRQSTDHSVRPYRSHPTRDSAGVALAMVSRALQCAVPTARPNSFVTDRSTNAAHATIEGNEEEQRNERRARHD